MNLLNIIGEVVKPITGLIDDLHTSDEEKMKLKNRMYEMQAEAFSKALEFEKNLVSAKSEIIAAEAKGQSWLQRSWRPITMLTFLVLVVLDSFGWLKNPLSAEAWTLLKIGLGGYVVGRSAEKIMSSKSQSS